MFVLRRKFPVGERPEGTFKTIGYPFVPAVMVVAAVVIIGSVLWASPVQSVLGIVLLATGVPAFWYWSRGSDGGGTSP